MEIRRFKRLKVEVNDNGWSVSKCPYNNSVMMGGETCINFCKYFMERDIKAKDVLCTYMPHPPKD